MFAGIFALEGIRAQLSQKCTFKSVWDPFKTPCKSARTSSHAACAQVFTRLEDWSELWHFQALECCRHQKIKQNLPHKQEFPLLVDLRTWWGGGKPKIRVTQTHFTQNEIQPPCISAWTEITMTRNASDPFGRQSRVSQVSNQRLQLCRSLLPGDSNLPKENQEGISETACSKGTHGSNSKDPGVTEGSLP